MLGSSNGVCSSLSVLWVLILRSLSPSFGRSFGWLVLALLCFALLYLALLARWVDLKDQVSWRGGVAAGSQGGFLW